MPTINFIEILGEIRNIGKYCITNFTKVEWSDLQLNPIFSMRISISLGRFSGSVIFESEALCFNRLEPNFSIDDNTFSIGIKINVKFKK